MQWPLTATEMAARRCHCSIISPSGWKSAGTHLVLVLQPASCCSWMRVASCCRSATSLPWACLMKGCSRRWVTDGRASKSLIRHLRGAKTKTRGENEHTLGETEPWFEVAPGGGEETLCAIYLSMVESWFVWISSDTSRELLASVLKSGSLICRPLSEHHMVGHHHGPECKQAPPRLSSNSYLWCAVFANGRWGCVIAACRYKAAASTERLRNIERISRPPLTSLIYGDRENNGL